jgi:hypothetical protein
MLSILILMLFVSLNSQEQSICFKMSECSIINIKQIKECTCCVETAYKKYKPYVPFTKKEIFDYIGNLSCKDLKDKVEYFQIDRCINQR